MSIVTKIQKLLYRKNVHIYKITDVEKLVKTVAINVVKILLLLVFTPLAPHLLLISEKLKKAWEQTPKYMHNKENSDCPVEQCNSGNIYVLC